MRNGVLAWLLCLCACVQKPALNVRATGREQICRVWISGVEAGLEAMNSSSLRRLAAAHQKRAIIDTDLETPYRCIGGVIFNLQRAGFQIISFTFDGIPVASQ